MSAPPRRVLIADDDASIRLVLSQALTREGFQIRATGNASTLWKWVREGEGDLVITDVVMPDENIFEILPQIRRERPKLPVVVMSAQNTLLTAVSAAEQGAYDYLPKPFDLDELIAIVRRALDGGRDNQAAQRQRKAAREERLPLIGRSAPMQEVYRTIARVMATDLTVLIQGESGTGKELVARALHDFGRRRAGPFVAMNLAAAPRDHIESELFGEETPGRTRTGRFEAASGGTLFLDEIGDMPPEAQTRLLRVLQEGEYAPVGAGALRKADVRIVAATNKELRSLIAQGLFREDLFFRLNVVPLRLPPLRDRLGDIPDLARAFLERAKRDGMGEKFIDQGALDLLATHSWPGNVRELENLMRRVAALYPEEMITARIVERELRAEARRDAPAGDDDQSLEDVALRVLSRHFASSPDGVPPPGLYDRVMEQVERPLIALALKATRGNQIRAAEVLGLNRNTLRKKIRALGVEPRGKG